MAEQENPFAKFSTEDRVALLEKIRTAVASGKLTSGQRSSAVQGMQKIAQAQGDVAQAALKRAQPSGIATWSSRDLDFEKMRGMAPGFVRGAKAVASLPYQLATEPTKTVAGVVKGPREMFEKGKEFGEKGDYSRALLYGTAGLVPLVGPWAAELGERAKRGDVSGALTEAATGMLFGEWAGKATKEGAAKGAPWTAEKLRQAGGKEMARLIESKTGGIAASQQGVISRNYSKAAAKVRTEVDPLVKSVKQGVDYYDARGNRLDIKNSIDQIIQPELQRLGASKATKGSKIKALRDEVQGLYDMVAIDPVTSTNRLQRMKPSEIVNVAHNIGDTIFEKGSSKYYQDIAGRVRHQLAQELGKIDPRLSKMQSRVSGLLDAERKFNHLADASWEKSRIYLSTWVFSSIPELAINAGILTALRTFGSKNWYLDAAAMITARSLWTMTGPTTLRAVAKVRLADLIDQTSSKVRAVTWPQVPGGAAAGAGAAPVTPPPTAPQAPAGRPSGQGPAAPATAPAAQASPPVPAAGAGQAGASPLPTQAPPKGAVTNLAPESDMEMILRGVQPGQEAPSAPLGGAQRIHRELAAQQAFMDRMKAERDKQAAIDAQRKAESEAKIAAMQAGKPAAAAPDVTVTKAEKAKQAQAEKAAKKAEKAKAEPLTIEGTDLDKAMAKAIQEQNPTFTPEQVQTKLAEMKGGTKVAGVPVTKIPAGVSGLTESGQKIMSEVETLFDERAKGKLSEEKLVEKVKQLQQLAAKDLTPEQRKQFAERLRTRLAKRAQRAKASAESPTGETVLPGTEVAETGAKSFTPIDENALSGDIVLKTIELEDIIRKMSPEEAPAYLATVKTTLESLPPDVRGDPRAKYRATLEIYETLKDLKVAENQAALSKK